MKVLYIVGNYPKISETYITTEIRFMLRSGVSVEVWSPHVGTPGMPELVRVHRGPFDRALRECGPDLVHVHYLVVYHDRVDMAGRAGLPVTVRGHSFDFSVPAVRHFLDRPFVKRLYLFPHFAEAFKDEPRVADVPVAYDSAAHQPRAAKDRKLVLRTAVAKPSKGLDDFFKASALCPDHRFLLLVNVVDPDYMPELRARAARIGRAELLEDVPNAAAAEWIAQAGLYMDTSDPTGHPFGMPISIAESLATGSHAFVRRSAAAAAYLGDAGQLYGSAEEAAEMVRRTALWTDSEWEAAHARAVRRSREFADVVVLPKILEDWKRIVGR